MTQPQPSRVIHFFFYALPFLTVLTSILLYMYLPFNDFPEILIFITLATWVSTTIIPRTCRCVTIDSYNTQHQGLLEYIALFIGLIISLLRLYTPWTATGVAIMVFLGLKIPYDSILTVTGYEKFITVDTGYGSFWRPFGQILGGGASLIDSLAGFVMAAAGFVMAAARYVVMIITIVADVVRNIAHRYGGDEAIGTPAEPAVVPEDSEYEILPPPYDIKV